MFKSNYAKFLLASLFALTVVAVASAQNNLTAKATSIQPHAVASVESDRMRDGLNGPVRRVRTEVAKVSTENGQTSEQKRVLLETAAYNIKGAKTENQYFPVAGSSLTGKEVYKYDERGNISEMTLLNSDGTLLSKETYKYDYDSVGNWTRMTTSVAVVEGGKVTFEPTEVTYRAITYYLDENVLKMAQPGAASQPSAAVAQPAPAVAQPSAAVADTSKSVKTEAPAPVAVPKPKSESGRKSAGNSSAKGVAGPALPAVSGGNRASINNVNVLSSNAPSGSSSASAQATPVVIDAPPPPANMPRPLLKPISGGVLNGKALVLPTPVYPEQAKRMRTMGTVTVEVVVDENGQVISATATSGPGILRDVAIQAASKAKFSPTKLSGQPVKVTGVINYKFSLAQ